jgi:predicted GNAT family acetyltransferase
VREAGAWKIDDIKGAFRWRSPVDPRDARGLAERLTRGMADDMSDIIDNRARHRFELEVEGHLATEHYRRDGNVIIFEHTEVPPELAGKGVGSRLVKGALDEVRAEGLKVIAQCPFVKGWIDKHPDYADLLKV